MQDLKTLADCVAALDTLSGSDDPESDYTEANMVLFTALHLLGAADITSAYIRFLARVLGHNSTTDDLFRKPGTERSL